MYMVCILYDVVVGMHVLVAMYPHGSAHAPLPAIQDPCCHAIVGAPRWLHSFFLFLPDGRDCCSPRRMFCGRVHNCTERGTGRCWECCCDHTQTWRIHPPPLILHNVSISRHTLRGQVCVSSSQRRSCGNTSSLSPFFFVFCLCVCEIFMSVVYVNARACTRACVVSAILNQNQGAKSSLQAMHERSQGCVIFVCGCAAAVDFLCYGSACSDSTCCVPCRRLTS